jgi:hypothetical protein
MVKPVILLCAAATFSLICAGCVIGPKYGYTRQVDSASMEGPVVPRQGLEYGSCYVEIVRIDGLGDNFTVNRPGLNWPFYGSKNRLYFAPGIHSLTLSIGEVDETYGNVGGGSVGVVGAYSAGATSTINVEFTASHVYRIGANLEGSVIKITLWDETDGAATRFSSATWTVKSGGAYVEATPPSGGRR